MSKRVSHTPPGVPDPRPGAVRRRHVFYLPGYDPEARSRYRLLFVRELTRYAKVFGQTRREIGRAEAGALRTTAEGSVPGGPPAPDPLVEAPLVQAPLVQTWRIGAHAETGGAETTYEVLLWDDIVARDFARSKFLSVALACTAYIVQAGLLIAFYRLNWKFGNVIVYPLVTILIFAAAAGGMACAAHAVLGEGGAIGLNLPALAMVPIGLLVVIALFVAMEARLNRIFFWQLVNDWVFKWQHGRGSRDDYERRLDSFADHVLARLRAPDLPGPPDEILIVGHSSGALTAVEVAARVIARDARLGATDGPSLGLVTLGSALPLAALKPRARGLRAEVARLVTCRRLIWVDYCAPQDWMNFPGFNPASDLDLGLAPDTIVANPIIRSARFRDIISPETYAKVRFRPFRMHFQFLMSNDRPGEYDYFDMILGPRRLLDRVLDADDEQDSDVPTEKREFMREARAVRHG